MKKSLLFLAFLFLSLGLYAQFSYGIKGGLNLSRMQSSSPSDSGTYSFGFSPSFHVGMYGSIDVSEKFAFSGDFLISDKGYKEGSTVHLLYASIPIMAQFKPIKNLSVGLRTFLRHPDHHLGKRPGVNKRFLHEPFRFWRRSWRAIFYLIFHCYCFEVRAGIFECHRQGCYDTLLSLYQRRRSTDNK